MKKFLLALMMLCSMCAVAQDVIVKTDGSTIVCRVQDLTTTEVVYKTWSDLNGANYVMNLKDVSTINYENGRKDQLSIMNNKYEPGNQNDGLWRMNDNALVRMDQITNYEHKAKKAKIFGWVCGGLSFSAGVVFALDAAGVTDIFGHKAKTGWIISGSCLAGSVGFVFGGNSLSNYYHKKAMSLQSTALLQQEISFNNGSSLALSVDLLRDNTMNNNAWGMGLKYNF